MLISTPILAALPGHPISAREVARLNGWPRASMRLVASSLIITRRSGQARSVGGAFAGPNKLSRFLPGGRSRRVLSVSHSRFGSARSHAYRRPKKRAARLKPR